MTAKIERVIISDEAILSWYWQEAEIDWIVKAVKANARTTTLEARKRVEAVILEDLLRGDRPVPVDDGNI